MSTKLGFYVHMENVKLRSILDNPNFQPVINIIMGNESCDLDSAVSAIVYAYFRHWIHERSSPMEDNMLYVPVLNIKRADLMLKTEVIYLLQRHGIVPEHIMCRDEIDILTISTVAITNLILVDHHIPRSGDEALLPLVREVIDHRPRDLSLVYSDAVDVEIVDVGSCATLICSKVYNSTYYVDFFTDDLNCALLLYGTIILDTANFSPAAEKARPLDFQMACILENILCIPNNEDYRGKLFNELLHARSDMSKLSTEQLLRKDMKIVMNVPMCGFPMLCKKFILKTDCESALQKFAQENNYPMIVLQGLEIEDGIVYRDIAIYSVDRDNDSKKKLVEKLHKSNSPNFGLEVQECTMTNCILFSQSNTKVTRKQIVPLVKEIMNPSGSDVPMSY